MNINIGNKPKENVIIPDNLTGIVSVNNGKTIITYEFNNGHLESVTYKGIDNG